MNYKLFFWKNWLKIGLLFILFKKIYNNKCYLFIFMKRLLFKIPLIKSKIDEKKKIFNKELKESINKDLKDLKLYIKIPHNELDDSIIIESINKYNKVSIYQPGDGKISGTVYTNNNNLNNLMNKIFPIFYRSNPLHPDIYPGIRKMEAEIIQMSANLLNSEYPCSGSFTSGGTESIILACRTYRQCAYEKGNYKPNILVCKNAHAAYWKAAEYLNIDIIELEMDKDKYILLENNIKNFYNNSTIAVIVSAPSFNFGLIDDINNISKFCFSKNIYIHVDMCLGGFILPFIKKYENISFLNKGISSISIDTHKFGCGPKGGSVILYKNPDLFKKQIFVKEDWTGGIYGTQNITGSRCGNIICLTWATLLKIGYENFKKNAETIISLTNLLRIEISKIPDIFCFGEPNVCIVAIGSNKFSIYLLADQLKLLGWNLNYLQNPDSFHLCITNCHNHEHINKFIQDIKVSLPKIDYSNNEKGSSIYATTTKINDNDIISDTIKDYFYILNDIES